MKPIINVGVVAHVDAGKTSLTEALLHYAGRIRKRGNVDKGTTATDSLPIEKERGISVRAASETFDWNGVQINLIDTPGHVDFFAEVERVLRVLDCAILVISAVDGVQANTYMLAEALKSLNIPVIVAINKIDRVGADIDNVLAECQSELNLKPLLLQKVSEMGTDNVSVSELDIDSLLIEMNPKTEALLESIVELDDDLLEQYFDGELAPSSLSQSLQRFGYQGFVSPTFACSAKSDVGIAMLLDGIVVNFKEVQTRSLNAEKLNALESPTVAIVFKIEHDSSLGKMAYLRVFKGQIKPRQTLLNCSKNCEEKIGQMKRVHQGKYLDIDSVKGGDIAVVSGLNSTRVGDVLGCDKVDVQYLPKPLSLTTSLLTIQVKPKLDSQYAALVDALQILAQEEPLLELEWIAEQREVHIRICGTIQLEILQSILQQRFGLEAEFESPSIIYQETPRAEAQGYERYWMPKPCWAIVTYLIKPAKRGSGITFRSEVGVNQIAAKYQKEIEACLFDALRQGIKGWRVTDIDITLIDGSDHPVHSRSGDFAIATPMALLNGLTLSDTQLLEPILHFKIKVDEQHLGSVTSDITKKRGCFETPVFENNQVIIEGQVPAATALEFPVELASLTGGKGKIVMRFSHYAPCDDDQGKVIEYRGVSPLDRDKWILKCRGALN